MVFDAVAQHVVRGGQHRVGHGEDGFLGSTPAFDPQKLRVQISFFRVAAHAAVMRVGLSQGALCRVRVDRRLPALSSRRGHKPAQEIRWPTVGKRVMSVPISAMSTRAVVSLSPGIVFSRLTAARMGSRASPIRASIAVTAASNASIWLRCSWIMNRDTAGVYVEAGAAGIEDLHVTSPSDTLAWSPRRRNLRWALTEQVGAAIRGARRTPGPTRERAVSTNEKPTSAPASPHTVARFMATWACRRQVGN